MDFLVVLWTDEDGVWVAECPALPGCVSQGSTRDEAVDNIREAIEGSQEVWAERGLSLPVEFVDVSIRDVAPDFGEAARRLELAQNLWDGMDPTLTELPLTPAMQKLLDERLAELRCDPDVGEPGEVVVVQLRQRLREGRADADR